MGEPLARTETAGEGVLADAARRLEHALQSLETAIGHPRTATVQPVSSALVGELDAARRRGRALEAAAAEASQALGRAAAEVRRALEEDEAVALDPQASLSDPDPSEPGLFDAGFDSALESGPGFADDEEPAAAAPRSEAEPPA